MHCPPQPLNPPEGFAPREGQGFFRTMFDAQGVAFAEIAFMYFLTARVFQRSGRGTCHGTETAVRAEKFTDANDAVIALFNCPCGAGGNTERFPAMLAEDGEVFAPLFVGDYLQAG